MAAVSAYLMGRSEAERGRLQRQAQLYGPLTRRWRQPFGGSDE